MEPTKSLLLGQAVRILRLCWRSVLGQGDICHPPQAVSIDTGLKFPEIIAFRDHLASVWGVNLHIIRPLLEIDKYPVGVNKIECCKKLKIEPLKKFLAQAGITALITGLRRDEHENRAEREYLEQRTHPEYSQVNALLDFSEMDVWAYTTSQALPFCELYEHGYRSLGCMPCTRRSESNERSGRSKGKEAQLEVLHGLGYF